MLKDYKTSRSLLSSIKFIAPRFERPVFIISAPRSGSHYFYQCIREMNDVFSFDTENTPMWIRIFPYQRSLPQSDYIDSNECSEKVINAVKSFIVVKGITHGIDKSSQKRMDLQVALKYSMLRKPIHYMEKTIANCFHIDAIEKIFPDALYLHLVRDGRSTISSMMEGWNVYVKVGANLSFPENSTISNWSYALPPGWENWVDKPLEEICAWSWIEHNRYVLEKYDKNPDFQKKYMRIFYEDFIEDPIKVINQVSKFCQLEVTEDCLNYVNKKALSPTTISPPKKDKWKLKNKKEIESILPMITPMMHRFNYQNFERD
ncbi:MAG: sulfotransferase [Cyanobacteria bacterium J06592_8]